MKIQKAVLLIVGMLSIAGLLNNLFAQTDTVAQKKNSGKSSQEMTPLLCCCPNGSSVTIDANTNNICPPTTVTFTVTSLSAALNGGTVSYAWYLNGVNTGASGTSYSNSSLSNGASVYCKAILSKPGCSAVTLTSNTVVTNWIAPPSIYAVSGPASVCQGGTGSYTTGTDGTDPATSYTWSLTPSGAGTISGTGTTGSVTWASGFSGNATLSVVGYGCSQNSSTSNYTVAIQPSVTIPAAPTGSASVLQGATATYTTSGGNATSYNWTLNGTSVSGTGASNAITFPSNGTGNVVVGVSANGCNGPSSIANTTVSLYLPVVAGTVVPSAISIPSGSSPGDLTCSTPSNGTTSYTVQWQSSSDGATWTSISGASALTYNPGNLSATTYYRVYVTSGTSNAYSNTAWIAVGTSATDWSYIRTRSILKPGVTDTVTANGLTSVLDVAQTTQYFDGLGRPIQTVSKEASPLLNDIVVPKVYDGFGRPSTSYLPYVASTNEGNYKSTAMADQYTFNSTQFPNEQYYYSEVSYEPSPLNRPIETTSPGANWAGSGRGNSRQYLINSASDSVQIWSIASRQMSLPVDNGSYGAGQLFKTLTVDENGNQVVEFTDKLGRTILKKVQASATPSSGHSGWLCSYYVYDTLQNLRVVLQPKAVTLLNGNWTITQTIANELSFRYEYDGRKRMVIKQIPGTGQMSMVYDARNRLVMQQDSLLRGQQKWKYVKYDAENRPDSTGTITDAANYNNPAYHDSLAYYSTSYPIIAAYPNELLAQNFYDDYSWISSQGVSLPTTMATNYTSNGTYFITTYNTPPGYAVPITMFNNTRGQLTGSMKKVMGSSSQYLYSVSFFDDRGRTIQTQSVNFTGAVDTVTLQYGFTGVTLRTLINHRKNGNVAQNHFVLTKMDYDAGFRLKHIWKNIDGAAIDQLIDSMRYNELGQLRAKYLGSNLDSLVYDYNVRGWLTGINQNYVAGSTNQYFGMELGYDKSTSLAPGNSYLSQEYNGNIAGTVWKTAGSGMNRKYDYRYDNANRLASAAFLQNTSGTSWDNNTVDFTVGNLSYDDNGNILTMEQKGFLVGGSAFIDQLHYSYASNGNRLAQVYDTANNPTSLLGDFHWNGTKQATDYAYDGDGNITQDNNRAISSITYNYLNLPQTIHMNAKGNITYTYDASGVKLSKVITDSVTNHSTTILYIGGFVYQQTDTITNPAGGIDTLQFITHEEGRARWAFHKYTTGITAYKFEYDFFERDHLGNTRIVLTQQRDTANYLASMEAAYRSTESQLFANIASTSVAWSSVPNYRNIPSSTMLGITNPNDSVSRVDYTGTSGQKTGPSLLLKVMSGDTVSMAVQAFYNSNTVSTTNSSFNDVLNSLAAGLVGTATGHTEGTLTGFTASSSPVYSGVNSFLSTKDPAAPSGYPKAYLNWIFLDDQFNYISSSSGSVAAASGTYPAGQLNTIAPGSPVNITKNGYLYIWVSNETQGWDVFFDNLSVQHKQGPVLEENHYYPFGLSMAGISDKAIKTQYAENKYRYNSGSELQNKEFGDGTGLELYETTFRSFDPQLGRFFQIDPLAGKFSPLSTYQYAENNPVLFSDPTGAFKQFNEKITPMSDGVDQAESQAQAVANSEMDGGYGNDAIADQLNSIISQAGEGLTTYMVNTDGSLSDPIYNPDPEVGMRNGVMGLWINTISSENDGTSGHYNKYGDDFQGGSMSTVDYTHLFVSAATVISDYNAYNTPDVWDYVKQTASIGVGVIEVAAAAASGGLFASMGVDGAVRAINGLGKLYTLATQGKVAASKLPSNLLGDIGAVIGGVGSKTQFYMQTTNDMATAVFFPGATVEEMGTGGLIGDAKEFIGAIGEGKIGAALTSAIEITDDTGATQEAHDQYVDLK